MTTVRGTVTYVELFAGLLDDGHQDVELVRGDGREQVVLDLTVMLMMTMMRMMYIHTYRHTYIHMVRDVSVS